MNTDFAALLLEQSPDAVIATDTQGRVLHWSKGAETVFGYSGAEAAGRLLNELVAPGEQTEGFAEVLREVSERGTASYECARRRKDGSLIYIAASGTAVRAADGTLECLLFTKKDVTRMKVMRDAKLVDARFRDLLESMPDGIVMINSTGCIVFSSTQAETLFGYDRGELRGQPIEVLLPQRFRTSHIGHRAHYFRQLRTRTMGLGLELFGLRRDGSEIPVEISLSPLQTEEGPLVMSAIREITERKRFEQALREQNLELEKVNLTKDRFLASMSHELRTPLNAILGFAGTLLMRLPGPLNAEQDKQLAIIESSAKHLLSLINDLLDLNKIESGKVELHPQPTSCRAVIDEVAGTLKPLAQAKGLGFEVAVSADDIQVHTDRRALSQILINLCNNAIKFTEQGQVGITCAQRREDGHDYVDIRIADTGIGIRQEDQTRLFQAFTQIDSSSTRRHEGTGLGLHLSSRLADLIGGRITLQSAPGQGSTFTLTLSAAQHA